MRKRGFTFWEVVIVLAIIGILATILFPVFGRTHCYEGRRPMCQSNLKQIGIAIQQYAQDYDEKFPPLAVARSGYWAGSLQPYLKSWQLFQCPSTKNHAPKTTDYFYNARLAQLWAPELNFYAQTVLLGDGRDDSPLNYALSRLPQLWRDDEKSPMRRHLDGANYAFADGHVKWLKPKDVSNQSPSRGSDWAATFALR